MQGRRQRIPIDWEADTTSEYDSDDTVGSSDDSEVPIIISLERFCFKVVYSKFFTAFMLAIILVAAAVQGIQTYLPDDPATKALEVVVTYIFLAEILLKLGATIRLPHRLFVSYESGKPKILAFNVFDTVVVILSLIQLREVAVLRLVRLVRLFKIVRSLDGLQLLLSGIMSSLTPIFYIVILLFLSCFFFGVIAQLLFDGQPEIGCDPNFLEKNNITFLESLSMPCRNNLKFPYSSAAPPTHDLYFDTLSLSMVTLFALSFRISWLNIILRRAIRCDRDTPEETCFPTCHRFDDALAYFQFYSFVCFYFVSAMCVQNLVIGVMNVAMIQKRKEVEAEREGVCDKPKTPKQTRGEARNQKRNKMRFPMKLAVYLHLVPEFDPGKRRFEMYQGEMLRGIDERIAKLKLTRDTVAWMQLESDNVSEEKPPDFKWETLLPPRPLIPQRNKNGKKSKKKAMVRGPRPPRVTDETPIIKRCPLRHGIKGPPNECSPAVAIIIWVSNAFAFFAETFFFKTCGVLLVILAAVVVSLDDPDYLHYLEDTMKFGFLVEILVKLIACGAAPWGLFLVSWRPLIHLDLWNILDTIVVVCGLFQLKGIVILRIFRILRIMRLIRFLPTLQDLLRQLFETLKSLIWVFSLYLLLMYVFGVSGVLLFRDIDPVHFGDLNMAFITLLMMALGEDWDTAMKIIVKGCDTQMDHPELFTFPPELCTDSEKTAVFLGITFFFVYLLLCVIVLLQLVTGIIISASAFFADLKLKDESVTKMLSDSNMPLNEDKNGIPHVIISPTNFRIFARSLARVETGNIWEIYRLITAHVAPLYLSKSILAPHKRSLLRLRPISSELHPDFSLDEKFLEKIPEPGEKLNDTSPLSLSGIADLRASRLVGKSMAKNFPALDFVNGKNLDRYIFGLREKHRLGKNTTKRLAVAVFGKSGRDIRGASGLDLLEEISKGRRTTADDRTKIKSLLTPFFLKYDTSGDGIIDATEIKYLLEDLGEDPGEAAEILRELDHDDSGGIDLNEFCNAMLVLDGQAPLTQEEIEENNRYLLEAKSPSMKNVFFQDTHDREKEEIIVADFGAAEDMVRAPDLNAFNLMENRTEKLKEGRQFDKMSFKWPTSSPHRELESGDHRELEKVFMAK